MSIVIPEKSYFKIGEVAKLTGIKPYILRYWESEFRMLRPQKTRSQHRLYRRRDVEILVQIKVLLYDQKYTIAGAKKRIAEMVERGDFVPGRSNLVITASEAAELSGSSETFIDDEQGDEDGQDDPSPDEILRELQRDLESAREKASEVPELRTRIEAFERQLSGEHLALNTASTEERRQQDAELVELRAALEAVVTERDELRDFRERHRALADTENTRLKAALAESRGDNEQAQARFVELRRSLEQASQDKGRALDVERALREELELLRSSRAQALEQLEQQASTKQSTLEAQQSELEQLRSRLEHKATALAQAMAEREQSQSNATELAKARLEELQTLRDEARRDRGRLEAEAQGLRSELAALTESKEALRRELHKQTEQARQAAEQASEQLSILSHAIELEHQRSTRLEHDFDEAVERARLQTEAVSEAHQANLELAQQLEWKGTENALLQSKLGELESKLQRARDERADAVSEIEAALRRELEQLGGAKSALDLELAGLRLELARRDERLVASQGNADGLEAKLQQTQARLVESQAALAEFSELERQLGELRAQLEQVRSLNEELGAANRRLEAAQQSMAEKTAAERNLRVKLEQQRAILQSVRALTVEMRTLSEKAQ